MTGLDHQWVCEDLASQLCGDALDEGLSECAELLLEYVEEVEDEACAFVHARYGRYYVLRLMDVAHRRMNGGEFR